MRLWDQNVEELRQSRKVSLDLGGVHYEVGEIEPVVKSKGFKDGEVLSGNHRKAAGWKSERTIAVKDDLDWALKRVAAVTQRMATENEQIELVTELCEALVRHGVPQDKVSAFIIAKKLIPWGQGDGTNPGGYAYGLIPNRFKRSGGYEPRATPELPEKQLGGSRPVHQLGEDMRDASQSEVTFPCPRCGCPGGH